ncbi:MAG: methyltransferase domain-containing protein [Acidobacteriaceae bacterium]|nr:methyltransferase domain-containing protein [Acidobacteriaceae bacterium]
MSALEAVLGPYINSSRVYLEQFIRRAAASVPPGSLILDAGAGESTPYRSLFGHLKYESADTAGDATYKGDIASLPVKGNRFDLILSTQLLEHVPQPAAVLGELFRVLKPGCRLWLTTPLFYEEHMQPYDYFRYTRFGLRRLFEDAGFQIEEIGELEGYFGTLAYQLDVASRSLPRRLAPNGGGLRGAVGSAVAVLFRPVSAILARFYSRLDCSAKFTDAGQCKNYSVIAVKP